MKAMAIFGKPANPTPIVAGVDEVGRGALFGPVVAAAVVVATTEIPLLEEIGVKDSKQLSAKRRQEIGLQIQQRVRQWRIGYATVAEIDRLNILQASLLAMKRAVIKLSTPPDLCLIDGRFTLEGLSIPQEARIQGDVSSPVIAAASIMAKVWRDELIERWSLRYPNYQLAKNKGYGTRSHCLALQKYGPSTQHRLSFRPCRLALENRV